MRVNMDSSIIGDPSFKLVAAALGVDWKQVIGSCFLLWNACYERRSERLRIVEANVAAECNGFAEALIAEHLATDMSDGTVIIHGVSKRIEFLNKQAERGAKGGKRKANSRPSKRLANATANATANAKPDSAECLSGRDASAVAYTPAPAPDLSHTPAPAQKRDPAPARALALAAVEELNGRTGRRFDQAGAALLRDCGKLARAGYGSDDVRQVIRAKAAQWLGDDKMRGQLKPSVLLRPSNFEKYMAEDVRVEGELIAATPAQSGLRYHRYTGDEVYPKGDQEL